MRTLVLFIHTKALNGITVQRLTDSSFHILVSLVHSSFRSAVVVLLSEVAIAREGCAPNISPGESWRSCSCKKCRDVVRNASGSCL